MSSDALQLESPMLPPLVLRPPLGPRVLRALVIALALLFHPCTAGWSLIANGREGEIAGTARVGFLTGHELVGDAPAGPLTLWSVNSSLKLLGESEFAARLPMALAVVAMIWFTMRLGERLGGTWRGFVAGMLLLLTPGMATLGRNLTAAPLEGAFIAAAFYALLRGYQERRRRRDQWFVLAWVMAAGTFFAGGWAGVFCLAGGVIGCCAFYQKAALRFSRLFSLQGAIVLTATGVLAWGIGFDGQLPAEVLTDRGKLAWWQLWLLFPWSILLLPGAYAVAARLVATPRQPLAWEEGLPLLWLGAGMIFLIALPGGNLFSTMMVWPAFALWAAYRLEVTPRVRLLRVTGVVMLIALGALVVTGRFKTMAKSLFPAMSEFVHGIPDWLWPTITSVAFISLLAFILFSGAAFWLEVQHQRRFAVIAFFGAMVPVIYALADASAKFAPYFSHAGLAASINGHSNEARNPRVVHLDGSRYAASSLRFYLNQPFQLHSVQESGGEGLPVRYLITYQRRIPSWEAVFETPLVVLSQSGGSVVVVPAAQGATH